MRRRILALVFGLFFATAGAAVLHGMSEHYGDAQAWGGNVYCAGYMVGDPGESWRAVTVYLWGPNNEPMGWHGLQDTSGHHLEVYHQNASIGSGWYRCQIVYEELVGFEVETDDEDYWVYVYWSPGTGLSALGLA